MTKSLQEIQKENRKFILEAIHHGRSYQKALQKELKIGKPLTFNRVLLAFKNKDVKIYNKSLVFSYEWERFYPLIEDKESGAYPEYKLWNLFGFDWDLTKDTLEEQSEETQRIINQLLTRE